MSVSKLSRCSGLVGTLVSLLIVVPLITDANDLWLVLVGGDSELDACGTRIQVMGLKPVKGNFLALREGPGVKYPIVAKLANGTDLWLCDDKMAKWVAVVVVEEDMDCGLSTPIADRTPYSGLCLSGWVHRDYLELIAG